MRPHNWLTTSCIINEFEKSVVKSSFIAHPEMTKCSCVVPGIFSFIDFEIPKNRITSKDLFFRRLHKLKCL